MSIVKILKYLLGFSYGLFVVAITVAIVTGIAFGIKYALEKYTSLNRDLITTIVVFSGILLFFIIIAPVFFGTSFMFLGSFTDALIPDF